MECAVGERGRVEGDEGEGDDDGRGVCEVGFEDGEGAGSCAGAVCVFVSGWVEDLGESSVHDLRLSFL